MATGYNLMIKRQQC